MNLGDDRAASRWAAWLRVSLRRRPSVGVAGLWRKPRKRAWTQFACMGLVCACGRAPSPSSASATATPTVFVAMVERGPLGPRLVGVAADGARQFELVAPAQTRVRDSNPAIAPDGRWLVFASSRGAALDQTALWVAPLGIAAQPYVLLPGGPWVDTHPVFRPDGSALVFASTRGGTFDLWHAQLEVVDGRLRAARPERLTDATTHEVTPHVAADGRIVCAVVEPHAARGESVVSRIAVVEAGGLRMLTAGPADGSPAVSPDGKRLAFSAPAVRTVRNLATVDGDIWIMPITGGPRQPGLVGPGTDETGPVWLPDGAGLMATSILRGADGRVLFSSVVLGEAGGAAPLRMLVDHAGAVERLSPVWVRPAFAQLEWPRALRMAPEYIPTLRRIVRDAVSAQGFADPVTGPQLPPAP